MLAERRSGYVIVLLLSLLTTGIPVIHMTGVGVGFRTVRGGGLFFIRTLLALGVTAGLSVILAAQGLWRLSRSRPR